MHGRFNRPGYERVAKNRQAPAGRLSRLEAIVDEHSAALENVEGEGSVTVRKNYKGGLTIEGTGGGGGSFLSAYTSYFKVYDASAGGSCIVGVKDGSTVGASSTHCGGVWINGVYAATLNADTGAITAASTIYAWLVSRLTVDGEESEVEFTTSSSAPATGGIIGSTQLLGRAAVVSDGEGGYYVAAINQDYLRGGEHLAVLYADCGLLTVGEE